MKMIKMMNKTRDLYLDSYSDFSNLTIREHYEGLCNEIIRSQYPENYDYDLIPRGELERYREIELEANLFCIKNNWNIINDLLYANSGSELITDSFAGIKICGAEPFNLYMRLWKINLVDDNWFLAFDVGNGHYKKVSKINCYKLI